MTEKELEEIKEIGRAVDALKKDTARIEREVNEIFKRRLNVKNGGIKIP